LAFDDMPLKYGRAGREARAVDEYQRMGSPVDRASASASASAMFPADQFQWSTA
jgi:hypothetical protein